MGGPNCRVSVLFISVFLQIELHDFSYISHMYVVWSWCACVFSILINRCINVRVCVFFALGLFAYSEVSNKYNKAGATITIVPPQQVMCSLRNKQYKVIQSLDVTHTKQKHGIHTRIRNVRALPQDASGLIIIILLISICFGSSDNRFIVI